MSETQSSTPSPTLPIILSMEVEDEIAVESDYRLQIGDKVKYLKIYPGTFDVGTLLSPIESLPLLPYDEEWNMAHVSRDPTGKHITYDLENRSLEGVQNVWHETTIDCLELQNVKELTAKASEDVCHVTNPPSTVIAKIARFDGELPGIELETRAYQLLEGSGIAPRFLGHIHEGGRIIGFMLEKVEGRPAAYADLEACEAALRKLHGLGVLHGDFCRDNIIVVGNGVLKLIDFEESQENTSADSMREELRGIPKAFTYDLLHRIAPYENWR